VVSIHARHNSQHVVVSVNSLIFPSLATGLYLKRYMTAHSRSVSEMVPVVHRNSPADCPFTITYHMGTGITCVLVGSYCFCRRSSRIKLCCPRLFQAWTSKGFASLTAANLLTAYTRMRAVVLSTDLAVRVSCRVALSMRDMLQVPLGWCSSGLRAKEYTLIPAFGTFSWC